MNPGMDGKADYELDQRADFGAIDRILATDERIVPSSGFVAAAMERVRDEAAATAPIPFPWKRALPGIVLAAGVLGWGAWETIRYALPEMQHMTLSAPVLPPAAGRELQEAIWVALALAVSLGSWALSVRLMRRSSWM